ncbi:MAG: hypothetical protein KKA73_00725 [Chloroflexi bacterium]|nr:hypothetical protein [Chloroflexota bacterium]MBU1746186.1 hypothetical protein [Chloroflexota bacterium]
MEPSGSELYYSELLHNSAAKWGLAVLPGRPLIGLSPHRAHHGVAGIEGNPYQPQQPEIIETLCWRNGHEHAEIKLFVVNAQWGYCLSVWERDEGYSWGPCLKFCDPYPDRAAAVAAAAAYIAERARSKKLVAWAQSLIRPCQLVLF